MMKRILLALAIISVCPDSAGQNFSFKLNGGYGWYDLSDLKGFQDDLYEYTSAFIPIEKTEQFPGYFTFSMSFDYHLNEKNIVGLNGGYYTSGGRNHLRDYSGEYKLDLLLNGYRLGLHYRYIINGDKRLSFYGQLNGGVTFSTFKIGESFTVYQVVSASSWLKYKGNPYYGEPSIGVLYRTGERLSLDLSAGYQFDGGGRLHKEGDKSTMLNYGSGEDVKINWSGFRLSLGLSVNLFSGSFTPKNAPDKGKEWDGYFGR